MLFPTTPLLLNSHLSQYGSFLFLCKSTQFSSFPLQINTAVCFSSAVPNLSHPQQINSVLLLVKGCLLSSFASRCSSKLNFSFASQHHCTSAPHLASAEPLGTIPMLNKPYFSVTRQIHSMPSQGVTFLLRSISNDLWSIPMHLCSVLLRSRTTHFRSGMWHINSFAWQIHSLTTQVFSTTLHRLAGLFRCRTGQIHRLVFPIREVPTNHVSVIVQFFPNEPTFTGISPLTESVLLSEVQPFLNDCFITGIFQSD